MVIARYVQCWKEGRYPYDARSSFSSGKPTGYVYRITDNEGVYHKKGRETVEKSWKREAGFWQQFQSPVMLPCFAQLQVFLTKTGQTELS